LSPGTTYYFRAKAYSDASGWIYGNELSFTTLTTIVTTHPATNITLTSATLNGETANFTATIRGFDWGKQSGNYTDSWTEEGSFPPSTFSHTITGLDQDTTYYFRAKAYSSETGWIYGDELSFHTLAPPGWLTGWSYRKSHVINPASGAGTNYQVRIKAHYGSGTDSGEDAYLNGKCRTDFGDIRFTCSDGVSLLDYWMEEKVDGDYAVFWVEVADDLSSSNATIYIYYGKSDATTTSNGFNTFLFFDDFEDGSIGSQWYVYGTAPTESGGVLTWGASSSVARWARNKDSLSVGDNIAFCFKLQDPAGSKLDYPFGAHYDTATGTAGKFGDYGNNGNALTHRIGVTGTVVTTVIVTADWHKWEYQRSGGYLNVLCDGESKYSTTSYTGGDVYYVGIGPGAALFYTSGSSMGYAHSYDNVFIRRFVSPEPTHGSWGSEETVAAVESIVAMCFPMLYIVKFPEEAIVKVDGVDVGVLNQPIVGAAGKVYVGNVECGDFTIESESGTVYVDTTEVGTYSNFVWKRAKMLISKVQGATLSHVAKDFPEVLVKSGKAQDLRSKFTT
jgi:hypothetical protein